MKRKLFCEISPLTYKISMYKCITIRHIKNIFTKEKFAQTKGEPLPITVYKHNSLIRRKLGNVDLQLQDNKAVNLGLSAPKVSNIIIKPGETFSLWKLIGKCTEKEGYKEGLIINCDKTDRGIGGGMCQLSNLIHWMILHTDMKITEHHHHDQLDLFPDFKRVIPFGTGTSIMYNYLDYRFKNTTDITSKESDGIIYRNGKVYRTKIDVTTGNKIEKELLRTNHARVCYDTSNLEIVDLTKDTK